ncbi:MAG: hypothetical protein M0Z53_04370 [Thermaerobacter sp.]|nr:hypothetical protein [Thermaerobacter sp.]
MLDFTGIRTIFKETVRTLQYTAGERRLLVYYEHHFQAGTRDQQARQVAEFLGKFADPTRAVATVDAHLKHFEPTLDDLLAHLDVADPVKDIYRKLLRQEVETIDFPNLFASFPQRVAMAPRIVGRLRYIRRTQPPAVLRVIDPIISTARRIFRAT